MIMSYTKKTLDMPQWDCLANENLHLMLGAQLLMKYYTFKSFVQEKMLEYCFSFLPRSDGHHNMHKENTLTF